MRVRVINKGQQYTTHKEFAKPYQKNGLWFDMGYKIKDNDVLELIEYKPHNLFSEKTVAVCKNQENRIILIEKTGVVELKKVRVINDGAMYTTYSDVAEKYENAMFWFDNGYGIGIDLEGEELTLIEYIQYPRYGETTLAICFDEEHRIIVIGKRGIEEIEEIKDETKEEVKMETIKVGDICEVVNGWGVDFQVIGTKVEVVKFDESGSYKTARVKRVDNNINGSCYITSIKLVESKKLLPVGTKVKIVKDILGIEDFTGISGVVVESTGTFARTDVLENQMGRILRLVVNPYYLENGYIEVVKEEEKWSDWKYDSIHNLYYRVKGNRIQAEKYGIKVQSKCMDCDTFDLKKGLKICSAKFEIKETQKKLKDVQEQLKELCK